MGNQCLEILKLVVMASSYDDFALPAPHWRSHRRVPTQELSAHGISGKVELEAGKMPDGAIIIAAITSCTNTSNPRNVIAAGLLARNANAKGLTRKPWVKSSLAPGSKAVQLYLEDAELLQELE